MDSQKTNINRNVAGVKQVVGQPTIRLSLLGTPELLIGGSRSVPNPLTLRLGWAFPEPVAREELIHDLYDETSRATARNRLRVALTRLRRTVPLWEDGDHVGLDPESVTVDVGELRMKIAESACEPEPELEAAVLAGLMPSLAVQLFPKPSSAWELSAQSEWGLLACQALERLCYLAEAAAQVSLAADVAEAALHHFPYDPESWDRYMRAMIRAGRGSEAYRRLSVTRRHARAENWPLPQALNAWATDPGSDDRDRLGPVLSPGESLSVERFFRRAITAQPELAIEMLGSTSFRPEVVRSPRDVLPLLREALLLRTAPSEAKERIEVRIITALGILEDYPAVLQQTAQFLRRPVSTSRRRIALLAASFAHAMEGDLRAAFAAVDKAIELASGPTAEYDAWEARAQRATFQMFKGELAEAEHILRDAIAFLQPASREGSEPDLHSIQGNLGICLAHQGRTQEAVAVLRGVLESAKGHGLPLVEGLFAPVLAFALSHGSEPFGRLLVGGLRSAYRISERRAITAAAYAGAALNFRSADPERAVLREALAHRLRWTAPLDALESDLFAPVINDHAARERTVAEFVREVIYACSTFAKT